MRETCTPAQSQPASAHTLERHLSRVGLHALSGNSLLNISLGSWELHTELIAVAYFSVLYMSQARSQESCHSIHQAPARSYRRRHTVSPVPLIFPEGRQDLRQDLRVPR